MKVECSSINLHLYDTQKSALALFSRCKLTSNNIKMDLLGLNSELHLVLGIIGIMSVNSFSKACLYVAVVCYFYLAFYSDGSRRHCDMDDVYLICG